MSVLHKLGQMLKPTGDKAQTISINKVDVLDTLDGISSTIALLRPLLQHPKIQTLTRNIIQINKVGTPYAQQTRQLYLDYIKDVSSVARHLESKALLSSFDHALMYADQDLVILGNQLDDWFVGGDQNNTVVPLANLKLSTAATLGYVEAVSDITRFLSYFLAMITFDAKGSSIPPYQITWCNAMVDGVAHSTDEILNRLNGSSFLDIVNGFKSGKDFYLETQGHTIDMYVDDNSLNPSELSLIQGFVRSPFVMVGQAYAMFKDYKTKQAQTNQEWLRTKTALLNLELAGKSETDPDYEKLRKTLDYYTHQLSQVDREVEHHGHR